MASQEDPRGTRSPHDSSSARLEASGRGSPSSAGRTQTTRQRLMFAKPLGVLKALCKLVMSRYYTLLSPEICKGG